MLSQKPWICSGMIALFCVFFCISSISWAVPSTVSYVGQLYAPNGLPISGSVDVSVSIFGQASDGAALWTESLGSVDLEAGRFQVLLGTMDPDGLQNALAGGNPRWLEFVVDSETLSPRQEIVSVPYALFANDSDALGGLPASSYLTLSDVGAAALSNQYADLDGKPDLDQYVTADEAAANYLSVGGGNVTGSMTVEDGMTVEVNDSAPNQATDVVILNHQTDGVAQLATTGFDFDPEGSLAAGLVSYWAMENAGATVVDLLNNNPLTATATSVVAGKSGNCRHFGGNINERLQRSGAVNFPTTAISVSLWVKSTNITNAAGMFTYHTSVGSNSNDFLVYLPFGMEPHVNGASFASGVSVATGQWRHVVQTWTSATGATKLYVDGALVADQPLAPGTSIPGGGCIVLGQEQDTLCGGFDASQAFDGQLDEVGLWNRVLTATEVAALYNGGAGSFYQELPGIGTGILFQLENPSGDLIDAARIAAFFGDTETETLLAFETRAAGGELTRTARLDGDGNLVIKGTLTTSGSPDIAENVIVSDPTVGAGDVVVLDEHYRPDVAESPYGNVYDRFAVKKASVPGQKGLLGVISSDPGILLHAPRNAVTENLRSGSHQRPLVLVGRVPVRMDPQSPPLQAGDPVTSSGTPGMAMRAASNMSAVGRAMTGWRCVPGDCPETVLTFVSPPLPTPECDPDAETEMLMEQLAELEQRAAKLSNRLDELQRTGHVAAERTARLNSTSAAPVPAADSSQGR